MTGRRRWYLDDRGMAADWSSTSTHFGAAMAEPELADEELVNLGVAAAAAVAIRAHAIGPFAKVVRPGDPFVGSMHQRSGEGLLLCPTDWYAQCMTTTQIAVRLPSELVDRLDQLVPEPHGSRSEAIRRAIELYVIWLAAEHDAAVYDRLPLTDAELAFADDPDAWGATPPW